jgi:glycosyltransferase involved in cell wall biosynthesis
MAPDLIRHAENGFLVDVEDADALAHYARVLLQDPDLSHRLGETALKTIQPYGWETLAERYYTCLFRPLC